MEIIDQIYMWKRLYWQAIDSGFEPGEAARFANRSLSNGLGLPRTACKSRISWTFAAVAA